MPVLVGLGASISGPRSVVSEAQQMTRNTTKNDEPTRIDMSTVKGATTEQWIPLSVSEVSN